MKIFFLALSLALYLSSCQQVTKNYCEDNNWRKEAFTLALKGENKSIYNDYAAKCKKTKVELDQQVFNEGFDEGAAQFCNLKNAFAYGAEGALYNGTCADINEKDFLIHYKKGYLQYIKTKYSTVQSKLEESNSRLWRKTNEFKLEMNTNPSLAARAYDELESYRAENERLKSELESIKLQIQQFETELKKY